MLVQDTFPELAKGIAADLRKLRRFDLVEQVPRSHIVTLPLRLGSVWHLLHRIAG